jgi:hypothetical protein
MQPSIINIIPGISIGLFRLSMSSKELLELIKQLNFTFEISPLGIGEIIRTEDYSFWIANERITQISIGNNQNAKINGLCGIGDSLATCERLLRTKFIYEDYITTSAEIRGLGLDIEDLPESINTAEEIDEFDERSLKVETIYIFQIEG